MTKRKPKKNKTKKITPKTPVVQTVQNTPPAEKIEKKDLHLENTCKVSVIVPCYNVEEYLDECLQSVINQSLKDIEIICVDDGSTDGTLDKLNFYKGKDKRIKLIVQENKGAGLARNAGINAAGGEYIAFMDPDDFYPSEQTLENMYTAAVKNEVCICGGSLNQLKDNVLITDSSKFEVGYSFEKNELKNYSDYQFDYGYWRFIYKREFILKNDLYFPDYRRFQDPPFMVRAFILAKKFYALKEATYVYRVSYKTVEWTERKACDLFKGVFDVINLSIQNNLVDLYERNVRRMNIWTYRTACSTTLKYDSVRQQVINVIDLIESTPLFKKMKDFEYDTIFNAVKNSKSSNAIVTVIVPVYNVEKYLKRCIDSIINQTFPWLEILCVNDGSKDKSLEILESYAKKDSRIKILTKSNGGLSSARNYGLKNSTCEYVNFIDSDDFIELDTIEKAIAKMSGSIDIVCWGAKLVDEGVGKNNINFSRGSLYHKIKIIGQKKVSDDVILNSTYTVWNKLFKTSILKKFDINFAEGRLFEDNDFTIMYFLHCRDAHFLNDYLYYYVQRPGSIMDERCSGTFEKSEDNLYIFDNLYKHMEKYNFLEEHKRLISNRFSVHMRSAYGFASKVKRNKVRELVSIFAKSYNPDYFPKSLINDLINKKYERVRELNQIIVSLTSYPARIQIVSKAIESILNQKMKADKIVLYLAKEQFPKREKNLPKSLLNFVEDGKIELRWCDDLKSHKKYYYAFQEFKNDLVITFDDDLTYHPKMIENLFNSYKNFPNAVSASRAHLVTFDFDGNLLPYEFWIKNVDNCIAKPSMQLLCTTGAGSLFPPNLFKDDVFDRKAILKYCLFADDLWLKINEIISGIPVVISEENQGLSVIKGSQEESLCSSNLYEGQNDVQLQKIVSWADSKYGKGFILNSLKNPKIGEKLMNFKFVSDFYNSRISQLDKDKRELNTEVRKLRRLTENHELTARIDIKNIGTENSGVEIVESNVDKAEFKEPAYMVTSTGRGKVIENNKGALNFKVRAINSGSLAFFLRGIDLRGPDGKRIPAKVTYTSLRINGEEQLKAEQTVWHDIPFKFAKNVKDGDTFDVSITWKKAPPESFALAAPATTVTPPAPKTIVVEKPIGDKKLSDEIATLNKKVADLQNQLKLKDGENAKIKKEALENCERILNMVKTCSVPKVAQNKNDDATVQKLRKEITRIKSSHRYRIGSVITFIPGSIRRWFKRGKK